MRHEGQPRLPVARLYLASLKIKQEPHVRVYICPSDIQPLRALFVFKDKDPSRTFKMAAEDDYPFWDFMKPDVVWIVSRKQWTNASFRCNDFRGHFKEIE